MQVGWLVTRCRQTCGDANVCILSLWINSGAISGWLEVDAGLEEYVDRLYGTSPYGCPPRPPPELNMVNFQVHISRVKALIDDAKYAWDQYKYIISWKNPKLTFFSLAAFVAFCLLFNAEYCGR
jgi:hypothetical protein